MVVRSSQAGVAQLVEQLIRNQQVVRSIRIAGSIFSEQNIVITRQSVGIATLQFGQRKANLLFTLPQDDTHERLLARESPKVV